MKSLSRNYHSQKKGETMPHRPNKRNGRSGLGVTAVFIAGVVFMVIFGSSSLFAAAVKQKTFASAQDAVTALMDTVKSGDTKQLMALFGPQGKDLVSSGDPVRDKMEREGFLKLYAEKNKLEESSRGRRMILSIGNDDWPYPIPIVNSDKRWRFDAKEGKKEILARRIGKNELCAMQVLLAFVDAQREYAVKDWDGDGILEYAEKIASDAGQKNGLYWHAKEGEEVSPLGPLAAAAHKEGYGRKKPGNEPRPYYGYFFRILKSQGKIAPGGAYDYSVKGNLIGGFGVVAYPATYGNSGVTTFIVNQDGVIYQKNLGKATAKVAQGMKAFNPDKAWKKVDVAP